MAKRSRPRVFPENSERQNASSNGIAVAAQQLSVAVKEFDRLAASWPSESAEVESVRS